MKPKTLKDQREQKSTMPHLQSTHTFKDNFKYYWPQFFKKKDTGFVIDQESKFI